MSKRLLIALAGTICAVAAGSYVYAGNQGPDPKLIAPMILAPQAPNKITPPIVADKNQVVAQAAVTPTPTPAAAPVAAAPNQTTADPDLGFHWLKVIQNGQHVAPGGYIHSVRPFFAWVLTCDVVIGANSACAFNYNARQGNDVASWMIGPTDDKRSMMLFLLPPDTDTKKPLVIKIGAAGEGIKIDKITCTPKVCFGNVEFSGPVAKAMMANKVAEIDYNRGARAVSIPVDLTAFDLALNAGAATVTAATHANVAQAAASAPTAAATPEPAAKPAPDKPIKKVKPKAKPVDATDAQ